MKFEMPKTNVTPAPYRRTVQIEYAFGETKVIADEVTTERMKRGFGVFLAREVLPEDDQPGQAINLEDEKKRHFSFLMDMQGKFVAGEWTEEQLRDLAWHFHNEGFEHGADQMRKAMSKEK